MERKPDLGLFASTARGVEPLLAEELRALGAESRRETAGGVRFSGGLETALRACLWSRTASRVLLLLGDFDSVKKNDIYDAARSLSWEDHLAPGATVAVDFSGTGSGIDNTMYGAQLVKDALVDRLRERRGTRPAVDQKSPGFLVNCRLSRGRIEFRLDLSGGGLHRRGYREETVAAPMRENLAAALLIKAGWPAISREGGAFVDPLCGSGTIVIEAALIAADGAPGVRRDRWGFTGWLGQDSILWERLLDEARERFEAGKKTAPPCAGYDGDRSAVRGAKQNAKRAGVDAVTRFETRRLDAAIPEGGPHGGLLLTNPPYGVRMGGGEDLPGLYAALGDAIKKSYRGWSAAVFTGEPELGKRMGLRAHGSNLFYNGAIPCRLLRFRVDTDRFVDRDALDARAAERELEGALGRGADAFLNRIRKNIRSIGKWAKREGLECYRLYDADLPEYAVAVDLYGGWAHVQEYAPPASVDAEKARERLSDALTLLPGALGIEKDRVVLKVRRRQKGASQYEKMDQKGNFLEVREGLCRFLVNLTDYLDTGLFLDHRPTRAMIGAMAKGKRFLNLFCYTGTATVHAVGGGAARTTSVDMSAVYIDWARRNLELNGIRGDDHRLVRADCMEWLRDRKERYDLIFLDPPTFSNSKRMEGTLDIQRDHAVLLQSAARLLAPGGVMIFSVNKWNFKLDTHALKGLSAEDISEKTIQRDFERNPRVHRCWRITYE
ncbi:MAG: bifunctional 23S rRNA (guanine(2069)-N(7))-methyltransferase RlmK/23S rRNA (guanine(2445)-N(2))-methyltransferase RlmL [Spirochaetes bacterium]|nr:bifunctional 23S rRNA (guanine(2069)-N(7))-methyltransferase RlmK/23S rRNA (guanine(2445)-N(2))-methyltransferase RlmL [Spirochaetota bacterium]